MYYPGGWIAPEDRNEEQQAAHARAESLMLTFALATEKPPVGTKIMLTDLWKHPDVVTTLGSEFLGFLQDTGSCVGVGGGNAITTTALSDRLIRKEPEKPVFLFWPYNYGRSRQLGGMRGQGEGSFGSTFNQSCAEDGCIEWNEQGLSLPALKVVRGQFGIGASNEYSWSDGKKAPQNLRTTAKTHKFQSAPLSSFEQVRSSILSGYGVSRAFNAFCDIGTATVRNGALIGTYNKRGGHQQSWLAYWNHPQEGELIGEPQQWGINVQKRDPGGLPPGAIWVRADEVDRKCKNGEIYAFTNYDGYLDRSAAVFDWSKDSFFS